LRRLKCGLLIFLLIPIIIFSGCQNTISNVYEIDKLTFVRLLGIDKTPENNGYRVTIVSITESVSGNSVQKKSVVQCGYGATIFDAIRDLNKSSPEIPHWGHLNYILIDENIAKDDLTKPLDFFIRENQIDPHIGVIITKNETAYKIIDEMKDSEDFISSQLDVIFNDTNQISVSGKVPLDNLFVMFKNKSCSAYVPYLTTEKATPDSSTDADKKKMVIDGYDVFKGNKLIDSISGNTSKGLNMLNNLFKSTIIVIKDNNNDKVSLEVSDYHIDIKPKIGKDDKLSFDLKVNISSNIGEYEGKLNIAEKETLMDFEKKQEEQIRSFLTEYINYSQKNDVDLADLGTDVFMSEPSYWNLIKNSWSKIYPSLKFNIVINSKVKRTYDINNPLNYNGNK
jgi:spore germination protein KC